MDELTYFKLKVQAIEARILVSEARKIIDNTKELFDKALVAAGLDPSIQYTFDEANHDLIPIIDVPTATPQVKEN